MGICLWSWCIIDVAPIWENGWIAGGDKAISIPGDFLLDCISDDVRRREKLLHIWCIRQPGQAMNMRAATMLPLKLHPVVSDSKHSDKVGLDEFLDSVIEEPVRDDWILNDSFGTA